METFRLEPGDILLTEASGSADHVGKAAVWMGDAGDYAFQNTLLRVRPGDSVAIRYLYHYFRWARSSGALLGASRGVGIKHLGQAALSALQLSIPALVEQERIAEILDQADVLRTKRRDQIALLDSLPQAIFHEMFEDQQVATQALSSHVVSAQIGLDRAAADQSPSKPLEYVKMDSITSSGRLDLSRLTRVSASEEEVRRFSLADGDLILNTRNSRELVGKTAVYRGRARLYNNNILRLRLTDDLLPEYLHGYLWSRPGRDALESVKSGTTNVYAVYQKDLLNLRVPVPRVEAQSAYRVALAGVEHQRELFSSELAEADSLFASLQSRAFRGEL